MKPEDIKNIPFWFENSFLSELAASTSISFGQAIAVSDLREILPLLGTGDDFKATLALQLWRQGLKDFHLSRQRDLLNKLRNLKFRLTMPIRTNDINFSKIINFLERPDVERNFFVSDICFNAHFLGSEKDSSSHKNVIKASSHTQDIFLKTKITDSKMTQSNAPQSNPKSAKIIAKNVGTTLADTLKEGAVLAAANEFNEQVVTLFSKLLEDKFDIPKKDLESKVVRTFLMIMLPSLLIVLTEIVGDKIPHSDKIHYAAEKALTSVSQATIAEFLAPIVGQISSIIKEHDVLFNDKDPLGELGEKQEDVMETLLETEKKRQPDV